MPHPSEELRAWIDAQGAVRASEARLRGLSLDAGDAEVRRAQADLHAAREHAAARLDGLVHAIERELAAVRGAVTEGDALPRGAGA
jgi:hypothetical protein